MLKQGQEAEIEFQKLIDHPGVVELSVTGRIGAIAVGTCGAHQRRR